MGFFDKNLKPVRKLLERAWRDLSRQVDHEILYQAQRVRFEVTVRVWSLTKGPKGRMHSVLHGTVRLREDSPQTLTSPKDNLYWSRLMEEEDTSPDDRM